MKMSEKESKKIDVLMATMYQFHKHAHSFAIQTSICTDLSSAIKFAEEFMCCINEGKEIIENIINEYNSLCGKMKNGNSV